MSMRRLLNHPRWLVLAGIVVLAAAAGGAWAAYPDTNVDTYTGCLNMGGSSGGQLSQVTTGLSPLKACNSNQQIVHLSGGDITKVTAGGGLSGGGDNGAVTLSLGSGYQLPQSCAAGKIPKWDGAAWQCADDQTYSNGTGVDLSNNTFSLSSGYQLPQNCNSGQVATAGGDGTWKCQSSVGGISTYFESWTAGVDSFYSSNTAYAYCGGSDIATGGGFSTDNVDIKANGPSGANGWYAYAEGGLDGGSVTVYVKCLHVQAG